ncbi:MAG: hypothetical protein JNL01_13380 [Bdellovibrionales bacterium]|nr:hypothetical protein [Bdellovibrionales bacterium]
MNRMISLGLVTAIALTVSGFAGKSAQASISMMNFQANGYGVFQEAGGNVFTGQVAWNPTMEMGSFKLMGNVGAGLMKNAFDKLFPGFNAQVFLQKDLLGRVGVQVGGGIQTWLTNGGTHPIASGNLYWGLTNKWFGMVDKIFAGYSRFFMTNATDEFRLGIGISI